MAAAAPTAAVGDTRELQVVSDVTRTRLVQYAGASGDFNPIHTDEVFATKAAGYPGVFAHGMLTMALTGRVLTDWFGHGNLLAFSARFRAQVWPGDTLTASATVVAVSPGAEDGEEREEGEDQYAELELVTRNHHGVDVLTGTATARLARTTETASHG